MKPIVLAADAETELRSALAYYELQATGLGADYRRSFDSAVQLIRENPRMYAVEIEPDVRVCPLRRFPYNVVYVELEDRIWVAAVAHQKREPGYWASRRPT